MATTEGFIKYVCEQLEDIGLVRYRKMFGEYMVYVNDKPILIVCDNIVFVKKLEIIEKFMKNSELGYPYKGAKEHYILDIDNLELTKQIVLLLESVTEVPKKKSK